MLAAAVVPASASATPRPAHFDWTLMVVTAGPHGASNVRYTDKMFGHGSGRPGVVGDVTAVYNPQDQNRPYRSCSIVWGAGGSRRSTFDMRRHGPIAHLAPGERLAELMFFAGSEIERAHLDAKAGSGSVRVTRVFGSGARGIAVHDGTPSAFGSAPGASYDTIARRGIAGGFVSAQLFEDLAVDRATWTAPDGSSGAFTNGGLPVNGCPSPWASDFAGAAGHWSWSWIGLAQVQGGGAVAGWAPVGRYWPLLRPAPAGPLGIDLPPASITVRRGTAKTWTTF
ncbi:MAG TPA: hypothetical protein VHE57_16305 [Mycobacteriales bacterium]|nr:hypothetical protein [Mycobacteriales bacterium]